MSGMGALQRALLIAFARGQRAFRWPGWLGLGLMLASAAVLSTAWQLRHREGLANPAQASAAVAGATATAAASTAAGRRVEPDMPQVKLPARTAIPTLLSRVQRAAAAQGLDWPRAEYKTVAATAEAPGSIEIRCTLKGAYPAIRRFLAALLQDVPSLTFKELALNRTSADAAEVEARLAIVIYLAEPQAPGAGGTP
jgi:hypothetical protein